MPTCNVNKKFKVPQNSNYSGKYEFERRCDYKHENWEKDQTYEGEFFHDAIHGRGKYTWNNSGIYNGDFYSGSKEGYGFFSLPNNSFFQGLFVKNQPFGLGILTHGDGCEDVGFWVGQKLVRLSRAVDLIVPRLASTPAAKRKLLQFQDPVQPNEPPDDSVAEIIRKSFFLFDYVRIPYCKLTYDPRSFFFDKLLFDATYFKNAKDVPDNFTGNWGENYFESENDSENEEEEVVVKRVPSHCLCPNEVFVMKYKEGAEKDYCDEESVGMEKEIGFLGGYSEREKSKEDGHEETDTKLADRKQIVEECDKADEKKTKEKRAKLNSWNKSEVCTEMMKQILRFQPFQEKLNFNISKLMVGGKRATMREIGEKEKQCLEFLESCALGPTFLVKEYLCSYEISEELMDSRGNNSLMFAVARDQHDTMDLLLDYGVDVNAFNDENLTPLNLCLLRRLAETNGVFDWETAFLPESVEASGEDSSIADGISDESLDGFVGHRPSVTDKKAVYSEDVSLSRKWDKSSWKKPSLFSYPNKDLSILSQITVINVKKKLQNSNNKVGSVEELSSGREATPKEIISASPSKFFKIGETEHQGKLDKYMFDVSPFAGPVLQDIKKQKGLVRLKQQNESSESLVDEKEESRMGLTEKTKDIDKTIEKLLERGADPNLSKVPRPSIHLGIFTKDLKIVYTLLVYGANPDSQLPHNEGLLTPLHVVALLRPGKEYVDICKILLKHGANPELETAPEFSTNEEEKSLLNFSRGRTPLHLLCMRPDIENANPQRFLIKLGTALAKECDYKHFYNGHSYLTLAMLCGNISLLRALLELDCFDPNVILGEDLGTALHVLVSTLLQMRTEYAKSLKMCDLLIAAGANPLLKFDAPEHLVGNCIDYGYREIEKEKMNRKHNDKSDLKLKKQDERDHLKDHVRVMEYLKNIALSNKGNKNRRVSVSSKVRAPEKKGILRNKKVNSATRILASPQETSEPRKGLRDRKEDDSDVTISGSPDETSEPKKRGRKSKKDDSGSLDETSKRKKGGRRSKKEDSGSLDETSKRKKGARRSKKEDSGSPDETSKRKKGGRRSKKEDSGSVDETLKHKKGAHKSKKDRFGLQDEAHASGRRKLKEKHLKEKESERRRNLKASTLDERSSKKPRAAKSPVKGRKTPEDKKMSSKQSKTDSKRTSSKRDKKGSALDEVRSQRKHLTKAEIDGFGKRGKTDLSQEVKKTERKLRKPFLPKSLSSEVQHGKLRHYFRSMFGSCVNFDVNGFLLPYVVLRDGDLYYRFDGKATGRKEQYSLV